MLIVGKFPILALFIHTILLCFISYLYTMFLCFNVLKSLYKLSEKLESAYSPIFAAKIVILSIFVIASITGFILSLTCLFFAALYEV